MQHAAAGPDDADRFREGGAGIGRVVQRLRQKRDVDAGVAKRQLFQLAALPFDVRQPASLGDGARAREHGRRLVDGHDVPAQTGWLRSSDSLRRSRGPRRPSAAAGGRALAPTRPSSGPGTTWRSLVAGAVLRRSSPCGAGAPLPAAQRLRVPPPSRRRLELRGEQAGQRAAPVRPVSQLVGQPVIAEAAVPLLDDDPRVLEQAQMARHARLGQAQDGGQLRHVQLLERQQPQQPQPRLVAEQPKEARIQIHIYKSTSNDMSLASQCRAVALLTGRRAWRRIAPVQGVDPMKLLMPGTAVLVMLVSSLAAAQTPPAAAAPKAAASPERAATEKMLIANERKVNEAVAKGDKAAFLALVVAGRDFRRLGRFHAGQDVRRRA